MRGSHHHHHHHHGSENLYFQGSKAAKKKNKRAIRNSAKEADYFGDADKATTIDEQVGLIVDSLNDEELVSTADKIKANAAGAKEVLKESAKTIVDSGKLPSSLLSYFV
uniref:Zuotin n=1 Tax=Saccharomyces cerevisiae (strain ATCC 204508 / S288c) TaxID=559292 RepID=UPI00028BC776|nr:Chain A, Zuotin [Saccharomyces cerevisiae S288C]